MFKRKISDRGEMSSLCEEVLLQNLHRIPCYRIREYIQRQYIFQLWHCIFVMLYFQIQSTIVPEVVLKEWAQRTYPGAADFWTFRKQVSLDVARSPRT